MQLLGYQNPQYCGAAYPYPDNDGTTPEVVAVIVTHNPDPQGLLELLHALKSQVDLIVVVDNDSPPGNLAALSPVMDDLDIDHIHLAENIGLAAAQNIGIARGQGHAAEYILLMDQDSVPEPGMVSKLRQAIEAARVDGSGVPFAAAGPVRIDRRTGKKSYFTILKHGFPYQCSPLHGLVETTSQEVEFLIASGSLIPSEAFNVIGPMRSDYFIDHIDREWCFRARSKGYRLLGVPRAELNHSIGMFITQKRLFRPFQCCWHDPLRHYYLYRNVLLLFRDVNISLLWKGYFIWKLGRHALGTLFFAEKKGPRIRYMGKGLFHGCQGVRGRLDASAGKGG